jgi:hypothetical protein
VNNAKLWTKDFIIVSSVNFLLTLVFYLLIVIIGVYAVDEYAATIWFVQQVTFFSFIQSPY